MLLLWGGEDVEIRRRGLVLGWGPFRLDPPRRASQSPRPGAAELIRGRCVPVLLAPKCCGKKPACMVFRFVC
uniref:Uncharacterized protein n=1 Tax=Arundo donax TaxID=35708 RepID=A0A0A9FB91_ARUDO